MRRILIFIIFISILSFGFSNEKNVYVIKLDGAINPAAADYIEMGIRNAVKRNSECLVIELNTPGGLLESTRIIVSKILDSKIPIVVYVFPSGSRAASAGVFITLSANIAAMASGTNIGAAHPVSGQGQMDSTMSEKVTNDAAAFIRTISEKRKKNIKWAEEAVRKSVSLTETEALKKNVIDLIAPNLKELLKKIDGRKIETVSGIKTLHTKDAKVIVKEMSFSLKLLSILSDPNFAYLIFMLGFYGILFEFFNPGAIFPGVIGGICLIIAFYSFHTLPINYAGVALIIFAIILFVLEIKIVSHGILTIGGIISLVLGSIMLIDVEPSFGVISISWEVIVLVAGLTVLFFLTAIGLGIKAQRKKPTTGSEGIVNETGIAISELNPIGQIKIHGEIWKAESIDSSINAGTKVKVVEVSNLILKVKTLE